MVLGRNVRVALVLAALAAPAGAETPSAGPGPRFRADGPDADVYGRNQGYPRCSAFAYLRDLGCRVGALSEFDSLFPARVIAAGKSPSALRRAAAEPTIRYSWASESRTLDQYLDTAHVTGLLIAKGDTIFVERYQYGRTDKHRLASFSMAKSIIGLLTGVAVAEGRIKSIDEPAAAYARDLEGTEYGRTPIRALLQMASGVSFAENYFDFNSDVYRLATRALGQDPGGSVAALKLFDTRTAKPGERFSYSSAESLVLGLVLRGATGRPVADYASEKLWVPLGAEADASWVIDATGQEITFAYVNAVLRDWARLGLMLAHDGLWQGKQVLPRDWVRAATSAAPDAPSSAYGFQIWLLPAKKGTFALRGLRGQFVLVDPEEKLVLVQTALSNTNDGELFQLWAALPGQLK